MRYISFVTHAKRNFTQHPHELVWQIPPR